REDGQERRGSARVAREHEPAAAHGASERGRVAGRLLVPGRSARHSRPSARDRRWTGDAMKPIQPPGWPRPRGYANGVVARGRTVFVARQNGWNEREEMQSGFVAQFRQALDNVVTVVRAAGGNPEDIARVTAYVTDLYAYRDALSEI